MQIKFLKSEGKKDELIYSFTFITECFIGQTEIDFHPKENFIYFKTTSPVYIPLANRAKVFEFIGMANFKLSSGVFEMDHRDGCFYFRNCLCRNVEGDFTTEIIAEQITRNAKVLEKYFPGFMAVGYGNAIASELIDRIGNSFRPELN